MAGLEQLDRHLAVATQGLSRAAVSAELAKFARAELAKEITTGRASKNYRRFVNGREGAAEEAVQAPGPILYVFNNWGVVIEAALAELARRSPRKSGRFAASFIVIVGGRVVNNFDDLDAAAEIIITNFQPYVRKAETGRLGIPADRLFAGSARAMKRRYGGVFAFESRFLKIAAGVHASIPYVLKGDRGWRATRAGGLGGKRNWRDRQPGQPLTYPAIVINAL